MIMRNTAVTMAALAALGSAAMAAGVGATLVLTGLANVLDRAGRSRVCT